MKTKAKPKPRPKVALIRHCTYVFSEAPSVAHIRIKAGYPPPQVLWPFHFKYSRNGERYIITKVEFIRRYEEEDFFYVTFASCSEAEWVRWEFDASPQ